MCISAHVCVCNYICLHGMEHVKGRARPALCHKCNLSAFNEGLFFLNMTKFFARVKKKNITLSNLYLKKGDLFKKSNYLGESQRAF